MGVFFKDPELIVSIPWHVGDAVSVPIDAIMTAAAYVVVVITTIIFSATASVGQAVFSVLSI